MAGSKVADEVAYKTEYEVKFYNFDFAAELETGETIDTADAAISPTGPTLGSATINGSVVQVKVTGGSAPASHLITVQVTTSAGESIEGSGTLEITDT
jgi:hypothetical protein